MRVDINCDEKDVFSGVTNADGVVKWEFPHSYKRGDSVSLVIDFRKQGYLHKKVTFNMVIENGGEIMIPKEQMVFVKAKENLEVSKIIDLKAIYYDFGKWDIRPDAALELDKVIKWLNENPDISLELSSHTDSRGSDPFNLRLSDKRAKSAADYITKGLANPKQISGRGYGETKLVNHCKNGVNCTDEEHAANRRTELRIVKINDKIDTKSSASAQEKLIYKVQIKSSDKLIALIPANFNNYSGVNYYKEGNTFKYTLGETTNFTEIEELRRKLAPVFKGCIVVKFKNGERLK